MADWEDRAKRDLKQYRYVKDSLDNIPMRLRELELEIQGIKSVRYDKTPVQGGTSGREDHIINNIDERNRLKFNLQVAQMKVERIEKGLAGLNQQEKKVLEYTFIRPEFGGVHRLCLEMNYEKTAIYDMIGAALRKYTLSMCGVVDL